MTTPVWWARLHAGRRLRIVYGTNKPFRSEIREWAALMKQGQRAFVAWHFGSDK
jgi:hypothetical protein